MDNQRLASELVKLANSIIAGCEKLPAGGMRDNCEKKKAEGEKNSEKKKESRDLTSADKTAVSLYHAAYLLFEDGMNGKQVETIMKKMKQPTKGYVYMEDVSKHIKSGKKTASQIF